MIHVESHLHCLCVISGAILGQVEKGIGRKRRCSVAELLFCSSHVQHVLKVHMGNMNQNNPGAGEKPTFGGSVDHLDLSERTPLGSVLLFLVNFVSEVNLLLSIISASR